MTGKRDARAGLAFLLFAATAAAPVPAEEFTVTLDPAKTKIAFSLVTTFHDVHGTFAVKSGALTFDAATGNVSGEVVVDLASGDSGNASRDRRMREEILETGRFPTAVLRPDRLEGRVAAEGDSQGTLHARLEFHGAERDLVLPLKVHAGGGQATATAAFEIPYVAWGLKSASTLLLHASGRVRVEVEATVRVVPAGGR